MRYSRRLAPLIFLSLFQCAQQRGVAQKPADELYESFVSPPAAARPFVRWWWNGNRVEAGELKRQLNVLKSAGFGGVEINPIALPEEAVDAGTSPLHWLSPEWNKLVALSVAEAKKRGMITDLIVGSGWPFGGEFLKPGETIQRVLPGQIDCEGGQTIQENKASLVEKAIAAQSRKSEETAQTNDLLYIRLVPKNGTDPRGIIDLMASFQANQKLSFAVPEGSYELRFGVLQRGHREVMHGALGAAGPVMNHYDKAVTMAYLNRLKQISQDTGKPLHELFRSLFCDSIELAGANWTDGLDKLFYQQYGYDLDPYLPFIFYDPYLGYPKPGSDAALNDTRSRVRYDYNRLLVRVFMENFVVPFQQFCTDNGVKGRYQSYGTPLLMGMMEGNLIPDIPEGNNWIYSVDMDADEWTWNQGHGYLIWNLYAAAGGHLKGRKIISCEAMTNTKGVFKTSLEEIKRHDDMNFITGINHTILHGYNYSPPAAGFPGWIRYGAYFSEQNTWWPYLNRWVDYNARLSALFQRSSPVKKLALLGPIPDIWAQKGLVRVPVHNEPGYFHRLWESISQAGSSCDYIDESIIREGNVSGGTLNYGPMTYEAIVLGGVQSLDPATAIALLKFVLQGGKLIVIDELPHRSLSRQNAPANDRIVVSAFAEMQNKYAPQLIRAKRPLPNDDLLTWTTKLLADATLTPDVRLANPDKNVFQIRQVAGERDIYFFVNTNRRKSITVQATFPVSGKTPWLWNPETGTRTVLAASERALPITLAPLESKLIVFEPTRTDTPKPLAGHHEPGRPVASIGGPWQVQFTHANGTVFSRSFDKLSSFGTSTDQQLNTFAGSATYTTAFTATGTEGWLELPDTYKGVSEVYINGKKVGLNWYGRPLFSVVGSLRKGRNMLKIKYTTVLSNYARSLTNNATAARWTQGFKAIPLGLDGNVTLYTKN